MLVERNHWYWQEVQGNCTEEHSRNLQSLCMLRGGEHRLNRKPRLKTYMEGKDWQCYQQSSLSWEESAENYQSMLMRTGGNLFLLRWEPCPISSSKRYISHLNNISCNCLLLPALLLTSPCHFSTWQNQPPSDTHPAHSLPLHSTPSPATPRTQEQEVTGTENTTESRRWLSMVS